MLFLLELFPLSQPVPAAKEQAKAPRKQSAEEYRQVVENAARTMQMIGCKPHQRFLPESVAGEGRIANRDQNKPGYADNQEHGQPHSPSEAGELAKASAQGLIETNGKQRENEPHRALHKSCETHRAKETQVEP